MESQPKNPEFRINPEYFHPWQHALALILHFRKSTNDCLPRLK